MSIVIGLVWLLARKYPASRLPLICLLASVCLAVGGQLTNSPAWLMICGSGIALAGWDLLLLDAALGNNLLEEQTRQYESKHIQSLILALGLGLLTASLGRLITLQIPFVLLALFIAVAVFSLDCAWAHIKKQRVGR